MSKVAGTPATPPARLLICVRQVASALALDLTALMVTEPVPQPCRRTRLSMITYSLYVPCAMVINSPGLAASIAAWIVLQGVATPHPAPSVPLGLTFLGVAAVT